MAKISRKSLDALPAATGDEFSLLAAGFRDYVLVCQDSPADLIDTLVNAFGWEPSDADFVVMAIEEGVGAIEAGAALGLVDPRAEKFNKETTVVERKKRG